MRVVLRTRRVVVVGVESTLDVSRKNLTDAVAALAVQIFRRPRRLNRPFSGEGTRLEHGKSPCATKLQSTCCGQTELIKSQSTRVIRAIEVKAEYQTKWLLLRQKSNYRRQ